MARSGAWPGLCAPTVPLLTPRSSAPASVAAALPLAPFPPLRLARCRGSPSPTQSGPLPRNPRRLPSPARLSWAAGVSSQTPGARTKIHTPPQTAVVGLQPQLSPGFRLGETWDGLAHPARVCPARPRTAPRGSRASLPVCLVDGRSLQTAHVGAAPPSRGPRCYHRWE